MRAGRTGDGGFEVGRACGTGVSEIDMELSLTSRSFLDEFYRSNRNDGFRGGTGMIDLRSGRLGVSHGYVCVCVTRVAWRLLELFVMWENVGLTLLAGRETLRGGLEPSRGGCLHKLDFRPVLMSGLSHAS